MKVHANAPLGPKGRATMVLRVVERGWSLAEAAEAAGVSERTCSKWVARYRAEGQLARSRSWTRSRGRRRARSCAGCCATARCSS